MDSNLKTFAKRLLQARLKAKLSMEKLSEKMNGIVTKQAISKYEKAMMMPSSTILIAMAEALNVNLDYFFRPFTFDLDQFKVSFRKKSDTTVGDQKALEVQIQDEVERYLEIEEILGTQNDGNLAKELIPAHSLSNRYDMIECAKRVRKSWELGNAPIANSQELLEAHGIKVLLTAAPNKFWGISGMVNDKTPVIVLNSNDCHVEHRRLTAFHELCHLLFNKYFAEELTVHEKENLCNSFANEMLLPSEMLINLFSGKKKIAIAELISLNINYSISVDAIVYKLKDLEIISEKRHRGFCIQKNTRPDFKKYIEDSRYKEEATTRFQAMVYRALAQQLISTSKAASLLGVSINNIRKYSTIL
jgi:Zn-dependent peptidase ImmA (M78 family)/DNA-binding XRE family transcriptional regulator